MKSPPPEEKLLRLIRSKGSRPEAQPADSAVSSAGGAGLKVSALPIRQIRESPWPRVAAVVLGVVLLVEVAFLIIQAVRPLPTVGIVKVPELPPVADDKAPQLEVAVASLSESATRPLFTALAELELGESSRRSPPSVTAKDLAARLTLLGIISGEPAQAIIEDSKTKKSHFVTIGQTVAEGAVLDKVMETYIILDLQGEKIELTL